jgi:hypothetical protein
MSNAKVLFLLLSSISISPQSVSADSISKEEAAKILELCTLRGAGAETTMNLRQMGVSLERSLEIAEGLSADSRITRASIEKEKALTRRAYEVPVQPTEAGRERAEKEFGKLIQSECVAEYLGGKP